jgi:hypothetical protein
MDGPRHGVAGAAGEPRGNAEHPLGRRVAVVPTEQLVAAVSAQRDGDRLPGRPGQGQDGHGRGVRERLVVYAAHVPDGVQHVGGAQEDGAVVGAEPAGDEVC